MTELQIITRDYRGLRESLSLALLYKEPSAYVALLVKEIALLEGRLRELQREAGEGRPNIHR